MNAYEEPYVYSAYANEAALVSTTAADNEYGDANQVLVLD